ncbi:transient receptor potential cation channel subfamily A member 1 [Patella vulgata]|uniref:transient receptor potential cation channel subfamily A member 1 n=1 Tax=Patella vulgata TaxID=6465 RepID=UPI0024A8ACB1|nr:transient receptor potential cation channel subfamily A member 1 [Patella vulgata]
MASPKPARLRRLTKQTSFFVSPGDASEDGDFVALRNIREHKRSIKSSKPSLDQIDESPLPIRKVSQSEITLKSESQNTKDVLKEKLFKFIEVGKIEQVKQCIENNVPANISALSGDAYRRKVTKENILHVALANKHIEIARYIIDKINESQPDLLFQACEVSLKTTQGVKNVLHMVTELHDLPLAKIIIQKIHNKEKIMSTLREESPVQIQGQRPRTFPCLHLAAFNGFTDMVEFYLDCGMDCNYLNQKKDTALLWAARWNHTETVKALLARKANPNVANDKGSTALYWAVRYGHTETVELLLTQGKAKPDQTRKLGLVAPIVLASALGYNEIVKILLRNGANVNHVIRGREMPIHHAAREGHVDVLKTLITRGASFDKPDERGDTALLLGAKYGHPDIVKTLVKNGADMKKKNLLGEDVWLNAVNNSNEFFTLLLNTLVEMDMLTPTVTDDGDKLIKIGCSKSPLFHAAVLGKCDKIEHFLNSKLDPLELDEDGNTFLMVAAKHDQHEVVQKFKTKCPIDAQNTKGNTALHIACLKGNHDTITTLVNNKAKANIKNTNGETALHVSAYSKNIRADTVKILINHVIKTHAWECLNVPDKEGKNPLHIAAMYASPEVLWEFRFVRYKDLDSDGNNALQVGVRPGDEESFLVMMDIFDTMKRDADINNQNCRDESVLHLAASECFGEGVRRLVLFGADLSLKDSYGDTVLHRLTRASLENPDTLPKYLEVFDIVIAESVRWWCIKNNLHYPDDNKQDYLKYKRSAVLDLTKNLYNNNDLSVLALACTLGASEIIERLTQMKDVMCFHTGADRVRYDVTYFTPLTNNSLRGLCSNTRVVPRPSCVEWLLATENLEKASHVLDLPPVSYIEKSYSSIAAWTYALLIIFHIIYMSLFSFCGVTLQDKIRRNVNDSDAQVATVLLYVVVIIEPAIIIIYMVYELIKYLCCGEQKMKLKLKRGKSSVFNTSVSYMGTFISLLYALLVIVWMILYLSSSVYQNYFLSVSLAVGWLYTIVFTRGFKLIHYFWRMIQNMIIKDVAKFLFVYLFVLLAFSFAFHVMFQVSDDIVLSFSNPLHTMFLVFNMMLGMDEIFTDEFETNMNAVGYTTVFTKVIYLFYMVLGTIVLLNLLIAMMNDSYSATLTKQKLQWRIESVQLGVNIEKMLPIASRLFSRIKMHHGIVVPGDGDNKEIGWYLEVSSSMSTTSATSKTNTETELINHLNDRITALDTKISENMKMFHSTLQDMHHFLQKQAEHTEIRKTS